jgi:hypothetical protein
VPGQTVVISQSVSRAEDGFYFYCFSVGVQTMPNIPPISLAIRMRESAASILAETLGLWFEKPSSRDPQSPYYGQYRLCAHTSFAAGTEDAGVSLEEVERVLAEVKAAGGWGIDAQGNFTLRQQNARAKS